MNLPNLENVRIARTVAHPGDFLSVAREPGTERLWLGHTDFRIFTIDFADAQPRIDAVFAEHTSYVSSLVLFGNALISSSWDRTIRWWDVRERRLVRTVNAHQLWVRQLALHAPSNRLASVSDDMTCKIWDATTGQLVRTLTGFDDRIPRWDYPNKVFACALSPDGRHVAAADETCRVLIWETETGREAARFDATGFFKEDWDRNNHPYGGIRRMAFSPDGRKLTLAGIENSDVAIIMGKSLVQMFDWRTGQKSYEVKLNDNSQYEGLAFHPSGSFLAAAVGGSFAANKIAFLDLTQPRVLKDAPATMATYDFVWGEGGESFYTVGRGKVNKWHFANA